MDVKISISDVEPGEPGQLNYKKEENNEKEEKKV